MAFKHKLSIYTSDLLLIFNLEAKMSAVLMREIFGLIHRHNQKIENC